MNWDLLAEHYCTLQGCSENQLTTEINKKKKNELNSKRKNIIKAAKAVENAVNKNPNGTREEHRKEAYAFILGSILLTFLVQALISAVIRAAIEWFLDAAHSK